MSETSKGGKARSAKEKPQSPVVSFRVNPAEREALEKEADQAKSTISDVARDRFRMNTALLDLHKRLDSLEGSFQAVRDDYRNLVDEERLAEKLTVALTETLQTLGPDVVKQIMGDGVREFYRQGQKQTAPQPEEEDDSWMHYTGPVDGESY